MEEKYEILSVEYNTPDGGDEPMVNMERLFALHGVDMEAIDPEKGNEELDSLYALFGECYAEMKDIFDYKICYTAVGFEVLEDETIDLDFAKVKSNALMAQLLNCEYTVPFAATLGDDIFKFITEYETDNMLKKKCMISLAYERLFTLCDAFGDDLNAVVRQEGRGLMPFIQPGDADFPIEFRKNFVDALETEKYLGLTVDEEGKFNKVLSIVALFGVSTAGAVAPYDDCSPEKCAGCGNTDCASRR